MSSVLSKCIPGAIPSALSPTGICIVVPCRNCARWIAPCLDSVHEQGYADWRLLVADDASDDGTADAVRPYLSDPRITYRRLPERGWLMANTWDALARIAPGPADVVAILDGDDRLLPGALERVFAEHAKGYDVCWTDMEIEGETGSTGRPLIPDVPVRRQAWCLSQLRTFKGYLLEGVDEDRLRDARGGFCRAAGDLALYFQLIERAGAYKTSFIPEKLYRYRVHDACNFRVLRSEQLDNNRRLRDLPPLAPQTDHFDVTETVRRVDKLALRELGDAIRARHPLPMSVRVRHVIGPEDVDSWRAYHGLWIAQGVYLEGIVAEE